MAKRNFDNFLDSYCEYAADKFIPEEFNLWSCLSIVAGALERKVWLPWGDNFSYYPNIYVMLVSLPGIGKSTALNRAVGLLEEMNLKQGRINFMPNQASEAKLVELMGGGVPFEYQNKIYTQNVAYFPASEASNSFKPVYGDIIPCLTDFYDCNPTWSKGTIKSGVQNLKNVCMNLLAGCTFDYLGKLVTDDNVMGGFASRLLYVVKKDKIIREQQFQLGAKTEEEKAQRKMWRKLLIEDLSHIHNMTGPFSADAEFGRAWEAWYPEFERRRLALTSEKMQSLLVRVNPNIIKVSMLLCAAESDEMVLRLRHWERAREMVEALEKNIPDMFRSAKAADKRSQEGLIQSIIIAFAKRKEWPVTQLKSHLTMDGRNARNVDLTISNLMQGGVLAVVSVSGSETKVRLAANPDDYI